VVIGTGGYVSWPVLRIAAFKNIATVLQEQNSFPGITTRKLARFARRIFLGFESARRYIRSDGEVIASGNPVRRSILNGDRAAAVKEFGLDPSRRTILVLGGSQGARAINNAVLAGIEKNRLAQGFQILWQTGKRDYKDVTARAGRKAARCALFPFAHRMDLVYAAADVAIARAGALTIAELAACGIPSILVPYPHAAGDHQRKNAQDLTERNLAVAIDEGNLNTTDLLGRAVSLAQSDDYLRMKQALHTWNAERKPAVDVIAEGIISLIDEARKGGHQQ
jgi:UDP-N-acetylglucosamine--N-acetylmuramyl-(pentapeptide) pyrophosphoryl-undecaprenol N-acetylglucosamine transferase